jgi:hypothetical protein
MWLRSKSGKSTSRTISTLLGMRHAIDLSAGRREAYARRALFQRRDL